MCILSGRLCFTRSVCDFNWKRSLSWDLKFELQLFIFCVIFLRYFGFYILWFFVILYLIDCIRNSCIRDYRHHFDNSVCWNFTLFHFYGSSIWIAFCTIVKFLLIRCLECFKIWPLNVISFTTFQSSLQKNKTSVLWSCTWFFFSFFSLPFNHALFSKNPNLRNKLHL